ncbi:unnamed protein product [Arctia plantaginis]|uniref:Guanylate kinase-like domain-containing protein n=1 Tax=Arctia plantaginis TaxID=874455 RepID=A0A8S1B5M8_ARCPL|nr:unnamed protein product [Arctia plantaginis]
MSNRNSVTDSTQTEDVGNKMKYSISTTVGKHARSLFNHWPDMSLVNFLELEPKIATSMSRTLTRRSFSTLSASKSVLKNWKAPTTSEILEQFPVNVTPLMNEENYWGCFYNFPELYEDVYSPVVGIRELEDVPPIENGVLTRDLVTACLTYLKRTPILGDYAYIKLDLSSKQLSNIDVLKHYKYLVYLDLSSNLLKELTVLSFLPYLQHLTVSFNSLSTILDYDTPQWFLTEVHYKFNSVRKINDLSVFWSITILDLSHNNIKYISGLQELRYLRRLDLSFNHIQRLENLNNLRLVWLDISYNNISSCEFSENTGLWTLLHLEYLNLNENNLTSLKMFSGCNRLRELYLRNNRLGILLELAVYLRQLRRLVVLDLRANPVCNTPLYKEVVINTFPLLLNLDAQELDPVEQRTLKMDMYPDVTAHATRRLLRLLYIQQLSRSLVSPYIPPADTTDVPLVIIVGREAVGKGTLSRRLTSQYSSHTQLARQHTTAVCHFSDHFIEVTRSKFDDMLLAGDFLTYSEMDGESYGLSREEAFVTDGRVRIASMDLVGALMLKLRGYRPYLILATTEDKNELARKQFARKTFREMYRQENISAEAPAERSTLQVLVSGRIIITGILNEIILGLPDEKYQSEFTIESECSLMLDSEIRKQIRDYAKNSDLIHMLSGSDLSLQETNKRAQDKSNNEEPSLYSLFKESQATEEYNSYISYAQDQTKKPNEKVRSSNLSQHKSIDFSRYTSSTWKGYSTGKMDSNKSAKSVTFTSQETGNTGSTGPVINPTGLLVEPQVPPPTAAEQIMHSISSRGPFDAPGQHTHYGYESTPDSDLWLAFLTEAGQREASDMAIASSNSAPQETPKTNDSMLNQIHPETAPVETTESLEAMEILTSAHLREQYESIHRRNPGLFWDTVNMDNPDEAVKKLQHIIRGIVKNQSNLQPMFDIDFPNLSDYPSVQKRLEIIRQQIAPQQLFY